jgi:hypothetical protein
VRHLRVLLVLLPLLAAASWPARAGASGPSVTSTVAMSGPTDIGGCVWPQLSGGDTDAVDEPDLAVNPLDSRNLVGVWLQGGKANAYGIVAGVSNDGGKRWTRVRLPIADCGAGVHTVATDATVSFGADGIAYVTAVRESPSGPPFEGVITRSTDGGLHWSDPVVFDGGAGRAPEGPQVVADPRSPGRAYLVWYENPSILGLAGSVVEAVVDWSPAGAVVGPVHVVHPSSIEAPAGLPNLRVLPDGSLLVTYLETEIAGRDVERSTRSVDGGITWSSPVTIASVSPRFATDPNGDNAQLGLDDLPAGLAMGDDIGSYPAPSLDVGPDGVASVAFQDITSPDGRTFHSTIWLARASAVSGWSQWTLSVVKEEDTQAFLPTVAVGRDGTIGVTYYDLRDDGPEAGLLTDYWFAQSVDGGATWQEVRVAGPYEKAGGTGEYFGLTALAGGFGADYTYTPDGADEHQVWFARIRTG